MPSTESERPRFGPGRALGWLFVFGLLAGGVLVGALGYRLLADADAAPAEPTAPDVIVAMEDLAQLTTVRMHLERVVDLRDRQSALFGLVTADDAILLVAAADVTAGVDLRHLGPDDVQVDVERRRVRVSLPPAAIFDASLDNEHTYVHSRETDALAQRSTQLETRARREAERSLRQAALDAGILARAGENAIHTVEALLRGLGYEEVEVVIQLPHDPEPDGF